MSKLPDGWITIPLDELGDWGSGGTPKRTNPRYYQDGKIPWLIIGDLNDGVVHAAQTHITEEGLQNSSAKLLSINTVLIAMYGSIGKLGITGFECATNQAIAFCKPNTDVVILKYLFYCLMESKKALIAQGQGGAQQNISQGLLKAHSILLAPLNEQKRIADKLDRLLAKVDNCRERLDRISIIIKHFRKSVLAAAVMGQLTEDWREDTFVSEKLDPDYKTIPSGWEWKLIKEVGRVQLGRQRAPKYHSGSNMRSYLRVQNVYENRIDISDVMEMDFSADDFKRYQLHYGDILLNEGQSPVFLGRPAMYRDDLPGACFTNSLIRFRASEIVDREFALFVFRHYMHSGRFRKEGTITTNIAHLSAVRFSTIEFPLPPLDEQKEIVRRVEKLFDFADRLEARYQKARAQIDKLTPALLDKAFKGELVPQDPTDETAAALLQKIQNVSKPQKTKAASRKKS
jgi:type I restriction enzyme, S subunit